MLNLVLVCGLARCGTNSISGYMHMHDSIMAFQGGPSPISNLLSNKKELMVWLARMDPQIIAGSPYNTKLQTAAQEYTIKKKEKYLATYHELDEYKYYVKRQDSAELYGKRTKSKKKDIPYIESIVNNPLINLKLIYSMRPDLKNLYASRKGNLYIESPLEFCDMVTLSYKRILQLKKYGVPICPVSLVFGQTEYKRIDRFLELEPSAFQQRWASANLITNKAGPVNKQKRAGPGFDPKVLKAFSKLKALYSSTREELLDI